MPSARLPAATEVSALIRLAEARGGFGFILRKGDPDSGTILVVLVDNKGFGCSTESVFERLPSPDGTRRWSLTRVQNPAVAHELANYLTRRKAQDADLWIVELTIPDGEQFILNLDLK